MLEEINTFENEYKQARLVKNFSGWKLQFPSV